MKRPLPNSAPSAFLASMMPSVYCTTTSPGRNSMVCSSISLPNISPRCMPTTIPRGLSSVTGCSRIGFRSSVGLWPARTWRSVRVWVSRIPKNTLTKVMSSRSGTRLSLANCSTAAGDVWPCERIWMAFFAPDMISAASTPWPVTSPTTMPIWVGESCTKS